MVRKKKPYLTRVLIAIDQLINVVVLNGYEDETISSWMGKQIRDGKCILCKIICKILDIISPNHCLQSIEEDEGE